MDAFRGGWPVDNFPPDGCNRGGPPHLTAIESPAMATIPQRIASAFTILFGQHGEVTRLARDRDQSRQSLYREAEQVLDVVDGTAARDRVHALEQQLAQLRAQVRDLRACLERCVELTPE